MNRLLLLVPVLVVIGCDQPPSTPAGKPEAVTTARPEATPPPARDPAKPSASPAGAGPTTGTAPSAVEQEPTPFRAPEIEEKKEDPPEDAPPIPDAYKPLNKQKTVLFEKAPDGTRRVHLMTEVVLREGPLEVFLCKLNTKEHEAILHVDADAREIHFALIAAGAKAGHPVQYVDPKTGKSDFKLPTGTPIKVTVTYRQKGKVKTSPAGDWIKDPKAGKNLDFDWVFAGSRFFKDPEGKNPDYYMANNGEVITVSNFPDSMLDVPIKSSKDDADRIFEADTPKIPPLRTPVIVTLEPVVEKKK
jgi:hypothetical protein